MKLNINNNKNYFIFSPYYIQMNEEKKYIRKTCKFMNINIYCDDNNKVVNYLIERYTNIIKNRYLYKNLISCDDYNYDIYSENYYIRYTFDKKDLTNLLTDYLFIYFEVYNKDNLLLGEVLYITAIIDNISLQYITDTIESIVNTKNIKYDNKLYKKFKKLYNIKLY